MLIAYIFQKYRENVEQQFFWNPFFIFTQNKNIRIGSMINISTTSLQHICHKLMTQWVDFSRWVVFSSLKSNWIEVKWKRNERKSWCVLHFQFSYTFSFENERKTVYFSTLCIEKKSLTGTASFVLENYATFL